MLVGGDPGCAEVCPLSRGLADPEILCPAPPIRGFCGA